MRCDDGEVWQHIARIVARSAKVEAKTGIQSSSVDLIRQLRAGEGRRD
ncbi:MAG: hypothetical protein SAK29_37880 [Scytonema sp. PMC 1069.18]|nr:hypothetical protein [Scytonema sp. PMC 1069.18]MEC4884882.1 hypothetical protein [Scytonema sp. PMC 1070.18]